MLDEFGEITGLPSALAALWSYLVAGGLPMMLYAAEPGANIDGAPIVNGVTVVAKTAEMHVKMRAQVSRRSNFARPPEKALREFLEQG